MSSQSTRRSTHAEGTSTNKGSAGVNGRRGGNVAIPADLRRLERLFAERPWPARADFADARTRARAHARDALSGGASERADHTALLVAAAELLRALADASDDEPGVDVRLVEQLERDFALPRMELAREVLRAPELMTRSPDAACRLLLATLVGLGQLRSASLWTLDGDAPICVCHAGGARPSRNVQQLARQLLTGRIAAGESRRRLHIGLTLGPRTPPAAAVVACANQGLQLRARALLAEAAPMLAALVDRNALLAANAESERALLESSERKLTRLGFDLHDGPIQDVAVLGEDLRLFGKQLEEVLEPNGDRELVRGRLEDLDAQLAALDNELRRLSGEVQAASVLLKRPFPAALGDRVRAFAARTGVQPDVVVEGDTEMLSASQQIALLNIIQEALSNIREHADAREVQIEVFADHEGVQARVVDDGRGFDIEATLLRAAREGRIGLLAMNERVRLLGGQCKIESRPGGPTVVSIALERWLPLKAQAQPRGLRV